MKFVFAILILVNLGLWMWASWYRDLPESEGPPARTPVAAEKMRLLSEPGISLKRRATNRSVTKKSGPPPLGPETITQGRCYRIGPFSESALAERAGTRLTAMQYAFTQSREEQKLVGSYRVFLPAFPSKQAAERKRRELTRLGFRDHALIQEEGKYAISLGVYSIEGNARKHLQKLLAKGIKARAAPLTHAKEVYWLELRNLGDTQMDESILATLKRENWGAAVRVLESACGTLQATPAEQSGLPLGP